MPPKVIVIGMPLLRWGPERLIESARPAYEIAGTCVHLHEALQSLEHRRASLAVVVASEVSIVELTGFCRRTTARTVLVTNSGDEAWLDQAVMGGVMAVVHMANPPEVLLRTLEKVMADEPSIARSAAKPIFMETGTHSADCSDPERSKIPTLTLRERQTVAAVVANSAVPGKVIASRLCMSEQTFRNHLTSIYSKLGVANRVHLYAYATRHAAIDLARAGRAPAELSRKLGPTAQSIASWIAHDGRDRGKSLPAQEGLTSAEREELVRLRQELCQVQQERDILAKATAWSAASNENTSTPSANC